MTGRFEHRVITLSQCIYRALLAAYPRRFRLQYRDEMALVFRDCCRAAYQEHGVPGLVSVWRRALLDLGKNAPEEHIAQLFNGSPTAASEPRSCSSCYSEVEPDWRICRICGTVLNDGTTHVTHRQFSKRPEDYPLGLWRAAVRPISSHDPHG